MICIDFTRHTDVKICSATPLFKLPYISNIKLALALFTPLSNSIFFNGDKALLNFSDVRKGSLISTYINNFSLYVCLLITPTVGICIQSWGALESTN